MARKLQQDEEEESKFRRDVSDLGRKLAIEAQDRELAVMLQEKEKTRLRKAKEKARLIKAQQKAAAAAAATAAASAEASGQEWLEEANMDGATPVPPNVAACLDPTWRRRQEHIESQQHSQLSLPITDLDFPATMQPIVPGQRRVIDLHSQPASPEPDAIQQSPRSKSSKGCSQQWNLFCFLFFPLLHLSINYTNFYILYIGTNDSAALVFWLLYWKKEIHAGHINFDFVFPTNGSSAFGDPFF